MKESDQFIIERILGGDTDFFRHIVEKYKDQVYNLSLSIMKNEAEAEEVAQESFIKAYKGLKGYRLESKMSTWLYKITYNTAITAYRKKKKDVLTHIEEAGTEISDQEASHPVNEEDQKKYIEQAINLLDRDESFLINLYYFEEKDINEISKIMDIGQSNVKVKLYRTRKKLYTILNSILKGEERTLL